MGNRKNVIGGNKNAEDRIRAILETVLQSTRSMNTGKEKELLSKALQLVPLQKVKVFTKEEVIRRFEDKSIKPPIEIDVQTAREMATGIARRMERVSGLAKSPGANERRNILLPNAYRAAGVAA